MKISFIVEKFPVLSETFILNQITGLIARGHDVDIYGIRCEDASKVHPDVEKFNLIQCTKYQPRLPSNYFLRLVKGIILFCLNFTKAPLVLVRSLNFVKYGQRALSLRLLYSVIPLLNTPEYDIIHCQFGMLGIEGMILRDIGAIKGKIITSFRGFDISWYVKEHGENVYKELFIKGDFFLTNCNFFRERAIKLGCDANKIIVHGSGIDCSRFVFKPRKLDRNDTVRIVTTGRLIEKKGIEYGIRAIGKLASLYANVEYNIIGDGHLKEQLRQLINELNLADKVKLLGWKNQQEIISILDASHIFIAPCVTASDGNQDAPVNTLKEAMAMGLPVIATRHGGIPELVEDGISGFLVPERNADALAEKLYYLIENSNLWPEMGKAGRTFVEKQYDTNNLNDELVRIYRQQLIDNFPDSSEQIISEKISHEFI